MDDDLNEKRLQAKRNKVQELNDSNLRSFNEYRVAVVENFNQTPEMDTSATRMAALVNALEKFLPEEVYLDFEIDFHTRVEAQLNNEWEKVREAIAEKKKPRLVRSERPSILLDQHGRPLT